ncbi:MAG TPA: hypothetical protein VK805_19495 [Candidatus Baltobacteraceae bacterium]|nr:hypothetical protein [Candidatus Baltobacteraceae bacterium]
MPDTMQSFVWELNDFLSSARKVVNYLRYEPGRPTGFDEWQKPEYEKLVSGNARFAFFRKLRNVSDKNCAIVPRMAGICDRVVAEIALSDKKETEFKHPETGETVAVFLRAKNSGAGDKIVVHKRSPRYVLDGWPSEDVLTFLSNIVATLDDFVCRAYAAYPNEASVFLTK